MLLKVMEIIERHHAEIAFPTRNVLLAPAEPEPTATSLAQPHARAGVAYQ